MRIGTILAAATAMLGAPPLAAEQPQPDRPKQEDKVVCKRSETAETGSRLARPRKTCLKQSEWKLLEAEKNRAVNRSNDISGL
jgi:hypothetical protein